MSLSSAWSKLTVKRDWLFSVKNGSPAQSPEDKIAIGDEDGVTVALRPKSFNPAERTSPTLPKPSPIHSFETNPSIAATVIPALPQFVAFVPFSDRNSNSPSEFDTISNTMPPANEHRE